MQALNADGEERVSVKLESRHYFRDRDSVQDQNGRSGTVASAFALFAIIDWSDGHREEVEQFDPLVIVLERAEVVQ